jgi:hypothetical protein
MRFYLAFAIALLIFGWPSGSLAQDPLHEPADTAELSIDFDDGRLTAVFQNNSLWKALESIGAKAGFKLIFSEAACSSSPANSVDLSQRRGCRRTAGSS